MYGIGPLHKLALIFQHFNLADYYPAKYEIVSKIKANKMGRLNEDNTRTTL